MLFLCLGFAVAKDKPKRVCPEVDDPVSLRTVEHEPPPSPERLLFDVNWGAWGYRWVHAGKATLEIQPMQGGKHLRYQSLAWGQGVFQKLYPVRDTVFSIINARGLYPIRYEKALHEGTYHHHVKMWFDQGRKEVCSEDTLIRIDTFTHDILSAFYYIRTRPLVVGKHFEMDAVSGKKKYALRILVHRKEELQVPAGSYKTLVVEPVLKDDGLFQAKGKLTIWLTDDKRKMPVKMESKIAVGAIRAELISHSP